MNINSIGEKMNQVHVSTNKERINKSGLNFKSFWILGKMNRDSLETPSS